jgi:hypothetical protein
MALALMINHANATQDSGTIANARRFAASGVDLILEQNPEERITL